MPCWCCGRCFKNRNNKPPTMWGWLGAWIHTHRCQMPGGHRPKLASHVRQKIRSHHFKIPKRPIVNDNVLSGVTGQFGHMHGCKTQRRHWPKLNWYTRLKWDSEVNFYVGIDNLQTQRTIRTKKLNWCTVRECEHTLDVINWASKRAKIRKHVGGDRSVHLFQLWLSVYFWK